MSTLCPLTSRWFWYRCSIEFEPTVNAKIDEPAPSETAAGAGAPSTVRALTPPSPLAGSDADTVCTPRVSVPSSGETCGAPTGALLTETVCATLPPAAVVATISCGPLASAVVSTSAVRPVEASGSPSTKNDSSAWVMSPVCVPQSPSPKLSVNGLSSPSATSPSSSRLTSVTTKSS